MKDDLVEFVIEIPTSTAVVTEDGYIVLDQIKPEI
jgi:hypothetical protein